MIRVLMVLTVVFHLVVPLLFAAWLGFGAPGSRLYLLAKLFLVVPFVGVLWTAGNGWHICGNAFRPVVTGAAVVGGLAALRWWSNLPWWSGETWTTGVLAGLWFLIGGLFLFSWISASGGLHPPDGPQVDLEFPLEDGDFYVVWGGSQEGTNRHLKVLEADQQLRGQAYAHDIVELNWLGARAGGLVPSEPGAYEIFGATVVAPCAGRVVRAVGDRPDVAPPNPDEGPPEGNFVLLECGDYQVALAHLQEGSLAVEEGDELEIGDRVGRVGNSGNTTEPHLHVHAQRPADGEEWMSGEPLVITFSGEFAAKGTVLSR